MDTLPTPDQINQAVNHTSTAIVAVKAAWADWAGIIALVYPIIVHSAAWFGWAQKIPGVNLLAGNYWKAANNPTQAK